MDGDFYIFFSQNSKIPENNLKKTVKNILVILNNLFITETSSFDFFDVFRYLPIIGNLLFVHIILYFIWDFCYFSKQTFFIYYFSKRR